MKFIIMCSIRTHTHIRARARYTHKEKNSSKIFVNKNVQQKFLKN